MKKFVSGINIFFLLFSAVLGNVAYNLTEIHWLNKISKAAASPSCSTSIDAGYEGFMGEGFEFDVLLGNSGPDAGFSPFIELTFPTEVSFSSANFSGISISPEETILVTDNDGGDPLTGEVISSFTGETLLLPVDTTYVSLPYPLGSHTPAQGTQTLTINANLASGLTIGSPIPQGIGSRCGYALGSDPTDNPMTDPPLSTAFSEASVTPTVMLPNKTQVNEYGIADGENTTGENYPMVYTLEGDIANGATITGISFTDSLHDALNLVSIDSVNDQGNGFTISFTPGDGSAVQTSSSVPFTPSGTPGPGGSFSVTLTSATGTTADTDVDVVYTAFIDEFDRLGDPVLDPNSGAPVSITNNLTTNGDYAGQAVPGSDDFTIQGAMISLLKQNQ